MKRIKQILEEQYKLCYDTHNDKLPIKYNGYIIQAVMSILEDYTQFLLKEGYCDTDVYAEEPTAIDQYLTK
jgi:hypothetical protein